jgi:hypothetical protein
MLYVIKNLDNGVNRHRTPPDFAVSLCSGFEDHHTVGPNRRRSGPTSEACPGSTPMRQIG